MSKEIVLIIALILSLALILYTGRQINQLSINKIAKTGLWVLVILVPLIGFFVVYGIRKRVAEDY